MRRIMIQFTTDDELDEILRTVKKLPGVKATYTENEVGRPKVESVKAKNLIRKLLKDGEQPLFFLKQELEEKGIKWSTARRVAREMGVVRSLGSTKNRPGWRLA